MTNSLLYHSGASVPAGTAMIVLNQPARRNAISSAMWTALKPAIARAEKDTSCKTVIITGAGAHFAAGADISEFESIYATRESAAAYTQEMLDALDALENCSKPTIAAIRGSCVGGGCSIAMACDFRFARDDARFGITPGKLGLVYSLPDTRRLVRTVGVGHAKNLLMTGRLIDASQAHAIGLADHVSDTAQFDQHLDDYAAKLRDVSQWSIRATKTMLRLLESGATDDSADALALMLDRFDGDDFREGYKAFLEKRKPDFPSDTKSPN